MTEREKVRCPQCGNTRTFDEHIEGLLLITTYEWNSQMKRYEPKQQEHGDHDDANLFCGVCNIMTPPEEYDTFLEGLQ